MSPSPARFAVVLGLLSAIGPISVDMYLPALPTIAADLGTNVGAVQMSVVVMFVALAIGLFLMPQRLWDLAPATFSGGEQQRVNIARSFVDPSPIMLIDEPTASLDANNRNVVVRLIAEARENGSAIVGIFHDEAVREAVATRYLDITDFRKAA